MSARTKDLAANALFWTVAVILVAGSIGLRYWIAGPDCFFATDVGVCQAIRAGVGQ